MKRTLGILAYFAIWGVTSAIVAVVCVVSLVFVSGANACSSQTTVQLPQQTIEYLDKRGVKELAQQNQERYMYAQQQTGVPWQVMAALHYREAGMNPSSSISNGAPLGSGVNVDGVNVVSDANQDAVNMANHFKRLALGVYDVDVSNLSEMTTDDWGKAFLAYNRGYLYSRQGVSYTQSPYVMNGIDADHLNMSWTYADTVSGTDGNKAGALTVMEYLGGVSMLGAPMAEGCVGTVVAPTNGKGTLIVTSGFGIRTRSSGVTRPHEGIDIVTGNTIQAMMAGTVVVARGGYGGYGYAVKIDHGNGSYTLYGHMVPGSLKVSEGENVIAGQALGTMGNSGDSEGIHLHLQVWENNKLINPYAFLTERGIKLEWQQGAYPINTTPGPLQTGN